MFSQEDDGQQGLVLGVVFGLVALVIALVIGVGIYQVGQAGQAAQAGVTKDPVLAQVIAIVNAPEPVPVPAGVPADTAGAAEAALDAASVKVENGVVKFYFASGKAELAAGAGEAMADVIKGAQAGRKLVISGFHDATGNPAKNAELAKQRAFAVRDALEAAGIPETNIELKKPEQLSATGSEAEARRVEVALH